MRYRALGLAAAVSGALLGIAWATGRVTHPFAPALALLLFLVGASLFPKTHVLAQRMRPLVGESVRVQAWSADLPGHPGAAFRLHSVRALGAGLHLFLAPLPEGKPIHLKIAQPRQAAVDESGLEIPEAKYVQWHGKKIPNVSGAKAIVVRSSG